MHDFLTADEAADLAGITKATLYAYVSRGLLQSYATPGKGKMRRYRRSELIELQQRRRLRSDPSRVASGIIEFGVPVLATAISMIGEEEHGYRGISSRELAQNYSFEQVCEFLWTGSNNNGSLPSRSGTWLEPIDTSVVPNASALSPVERMQTLLPYLERQSLNAYGTRAPELVPIATRIMLYFTYISASSVYKESVSHTLANEWQVDPRALETLLIVVADHELNIATFTARCAASAGASLHQSVLAGLASLQGYKHLFGQVAEARTFFQEILDRRDPEKVVRRYLQRHASVPGFNNPYRPLYRDHDPRVDTLVINLEGCEGAHLLNETIKLVVAGTNEPPRVDFALAVSECLLKLPRDSIFSLIALGRTAGIIAHILEQFVSDRVIRPRAKYVGPIETVEV